MPVLGTTYGGWYIPDDFVLSSDSLVVSAGVGEDISFDLALQSRYGCEILLIDPTQRAIKHLQEVHTYYKDKTPFLGNIQSDYISHISPLNPDLRKLTLKPIGLWKEKDTLKFFYQTNPLYVSQSLIPNLYSSSYSLVPVDRLSRLISKTPDVLKLDIEGAEIDVLETLFEDNIFPRLLCVEFDLLLKGQDKTNRTHQMIERLMRKGYKLVYNKNYNMVFQLS
jgi:hypothetical protein